MGARRVDAWAAWRQVVTEIYGRGVRFPLSLSRSGGIAETADVEKVEQSVRMILGTQYGERVMRPRFGCNLRTLMFAPNNAATANLARFYVEEGLRTWEPRIELVDVTVDNDNA
jgi:phage baseplate assembly protein W